jgi:hypothetical protein
MGAGADAPGAGCHRPWQHPPLAGLLHWRSRRYTPSPEASPPTITGLDAGGWEKVRAIFPDRRKPRPVSSIRRRTAKSKAKRAGPCFRSRGKSDRHSRANGNPASLRPRGRVARPSRRGLAQAACAAPVRSRERRPACKAAYRTAPSTCRFLSSSFRSVTSVSVVSISPAMLAAFSSAQRTTLVGSMMPALNMSTYFPVFAS